jgi:hypothetical protein
MGRTRLILCPSWRGTPTTLKTEYNARMTFISHTCRPKTRYSMLKLSLPIIVQAELCSSGNVVLWN